MSDKTIKGSSTVLACEMKKLLNNQLMSDVLFEVGSERKVFYGHKCLLVARCEIFRSMFAANDASRTCATPVVLQEMRPDIFRQLLEFLYTNQIKLERGGVDGTIELLAVSMEFGLDDLRKNLQIHLLHSLTKDNAGKIVQSAHNLHLTQLKENCMRFIHTNIKIVTDTGELSAELMEEVVASDDLDIEERDLVTLVRAWARLIATRTDQPPSQFAKVVCRHLRLGLLCPEEIGQLEEENHREDIIPAETFSLAWKTHALGPAGAAGANIAPQARSGARTAKSTVRGVSNRSSSQAVFD